MWPLMNPFAGLRPCSVTWGLVFILLQHASNADLLSATSWFQLHHSPSVRANKVINDSIMQTATEDKKTNSPDSVLSPSGWKNVLLIAETTDPNVSPGKVQLRYQQKHKVSITDPCLDPSCATSELLSLLPSPLCKPRTAPDQTSDCQQIHGHSLASHPSSAYSLQWTKILHSHYRTLVPLPPVWEFLFVKAQ